MDVCVPGEKFPTTCTSNNKLLNVRKLSPSITALSAKIRTLCVNLLYRADLILAKACVYLNSRREPGGWGLPHQVNSDSLLSCHLKV